MQAQTHSSRRRSVDSSATAAAATRASAASAACSRSAHRKASCQEGAGQGVAGMQLRSRCLQRGKHAALPSASRSWHLPHSQKQRRPSGLILPARLMPGRPARSRAVRRAEPGDPQAGPPCPLSAPRTQSSHMGSSAHPCEELEIDCFPPAPAVPAQGEGAARSTRSRCPPARPWEIALEIPDGYRAKRIELQQQVFLLLVIYDHVGSGAGVSERGRARESHVSVSLRSVHARLFKICSTCHPKPLLAVAKANRSPPPPWLSWVTSAYTWNVSQLFHGSRREGVTRPRPPCAACRS